jgi:hypothetical protein
MDAKLVPKLFNQGPLINEGFCSISRPAIKIIAGIFFIFRELFFEYNPSEIGFVPVE